MKQGLCIQQMIGLLIKKKKKLNLCSLLFVERNSQNRSHFTKPQNFCALLEQKDKVTEAIVSLDWSPTLFCMKGFIYFFILIKIFCFDINLQHVYLKYYKINIYKLCNGEYCFLCYEYCESSFYISNNLHKFYHKQQL